MRVVIADDDSVTRKLLEFHLRKWGHEVVACSTGAEAWHVIRQGPAPQLVVLDWVMPEMDGISVCRQIRAADLRTYVYVILLTSRNARHEIVEGLEAGADDYIVKPFNPEELKVRIRAGARIVKLQEDLLKALASAQFEASHDSLTGLWNRAAILESLRKELARSGRDGNPVSVIISDVDHFKRINDEYGHVFGDAVLTEVAGRLASSVRAYDSVGRYGGEEFIIILPGSETEEAARTAERLRADFDERLVATGEEALHVTLSFGVMGTDLNGSRTVDSVVRAADEALYRAKNLGRNRVEVFGEHYIAERDPDYGPIKFPALTDHDAAGVPFVQREAINA